MTPRIPVGPMLALLLTMAAGCPRPASIRGLADIHIHQMTDLGFGGGFLWGKHDGPLAEALPKCSGGLDHGFLVGEGFLGIHLRRRHGYPTFDGWPRWDSISHQTVHADWLRQAHRDGLKLIVMSAVNFEPYCRLIPRRFRRTEWGCDDMSAVDRQLRAAHAFARKHSWYEIALDPAHARRIIRAGKMAVVLAIEASDLFGKGDLVKQLDKYHRLGVRALQPVHQLDNRFAGAAHHHLALRIAQKLRTPDRGGLLSGFELDAKGKNVRGLSAEGKRLVREMMRRRMLIDLAHLSERSVRDAFVIARENRSYPLFLSHGHFRELMPPKKQKEEKTTPAWVVRAIKRTGGIFGLRTGPEQTLTYRPAGVANNCHGSSRSFAQLYALGIKGMRIPLALASDLNGFIAQMVPRFGGKDACRKTFRFERRAQRRAQGSRRRNGLGTDFDTKGFAHIGLIGDVVRDVRKLGVDTGPLWRSAEAFVRMWERVYDPSRGPLPDEVNLRGIEPYRTRRERRRALRSAK